MQAKGSASAAGYEMQHLRMGFTSISTRGDHRGHAPDDRLTRRRYRIRQWVVYARVDALDHLPHSRTRSRIRKAGVDPAVKRNCSKRMRILAFADYYLPGYKAGGPIRTLVNLVHRLGDEFSFRIVTRDRDVGDGQPHPGIDLNSWQAVGKAHVLYLSPRNLGAPNLRRILNGSDHQLLYLNSFFSPVFTIQTLIMRRAGLIRATPVILAPRGEFSPEALRIKSTKKSAYLQLAKSLDLCRAITWQASSQHEEEDIRRQFDEKANIFIAPNLPLEGAQAVTELRKRNKTPGALRIVFLSRISRMKNLSGALRMLHGITGNVHLDIYGPIKEKEYWRECERVIETLPANIAARHRGSVLHSEVRNVLSEYELFFLPTLGENFGHAIHEALASGCPVLVSDRTPWKNLKERGVGWDLPLSSPNLFQAALQQCVDMGDEEFNTLSENAYRFAISQSQETEPVNRNREMFGAILARP